MGRIRRAIVLAGCVLAIVAIGFLDWWTGLEARVFPLYFIPIAVGVQAGGRVPRYLMAAFATVVWGVAYDLAGEGLVHLVELWNILAQFAAFTLVAYLVGRQWDHRKREEALSREDYLTGLQNSRAFFQALSSEVERSNRYHHPLTLAYLDLDDFKRVNDTKGHPTGDEVLKTVARILKSELRSSDVIARLGGDEFAILLVETDRASAESVLRKVHDAMISGLAAVAGGATPSIGAATCESYVPAASELIRQADALMYEVKRAGKNGCLVRPVL